MHTHPTSANLDQNFALVRAFRSLRVGDADIIAKVVDAFGDTWSVQTGDDYDGYLFMLIEPSDDKDEQLPNYMVTGQIGQIELAMVDGDDCRTLGRFEDIYGLTAELTFRLLDVATGSYDLQHQCRSRFPTSSTK